MTDDPRATHEEPLVTVAVVSWNTSVLLDRCLASLRPAHDAGLASVWVVDNGSSDDSVAMVRERHGWVHLLISEDNLGYGGAINLVADRTHTPWFVISNADIEVHPGSLDGLLRAGLNDPEAGVLAPRLLLPDGSTQHSVWPFPTPLAALAQNLGPRLAPKRLGERLLVPGAWKPARSRRVPWAIGAFLLVRRSAWDQVGGFDPRQWMSAEDLELGWRMQKAGWRARYVPEALVNHAESAAVHQVWGTGRAVHWQRCAYAWMLRRMGRRQMLAVGAINLFGSAARLFLLLADRDVGAREALPGLRAWTAVHCYAFAPAKILERYR